MLSYLSHNEEQTIKFGKVLAKSLKPGDIICLSGELGSGKTTLVKGIAEGLHINASKVHSPTFVLMNFYEGKLPVYHFDLYRIEGAQDISLLGYEEFFYGDGVSVVEWSEKLGNLAPKDYLKVQMYHKGESTRMLKISYVGKAHKELIERISKGLDKKK